MTIRLFTIFLPLLIVTALPVHAASQRITTRENAIREQCAFFSPVRVKVFYGDTVNITVREGDWFRVTFRGTHGCIHKSAVEEKAFSLSKTGDLGRASASEAEVALAGKGFNQQVEDSYGKKHPEADFRTVDLVEGYAVTDFQLEEFIRSGALNRP